MSKEIEALVLEHRNIKRVLDAMVTALDEVGDDAGICKLLGGALAYLSGFERKIHHRKEEALLKRLVAIDASLQEVQEGLAKQRKRLAQMEKDLHCSILALGMGDRVARARLSDQLPVYREAYRNCMAVEEGLPYAQAAAHLQWRDWRQVFGKFAHVPDPVFDRNPSLAFPNLNAALIAYGEAEDARRRKGANLRK